jgi:hypothetical protein
MELDDQKKKLIEDTTIAWMKEHAPGINGYKASPDWSCILHVGEVLGVEINEGQEAGKVTLQVYKAWKKYRESQ